MFLPRHSCPSDLAHELGLPISQRAFFPSAEMLALHSRLSRNLNPFSENTTHFRTFFYTLSTPSYYSHLMVDLHSRHCEPPLLPSQPAMRWMWDDARSRMPRQCTSAESVQIQNVQFIFHDRRFEQNTNDSAVMFTAVSKKDCTATNYVILVRRRWGQKT